MAFSITAVLVFGMCRMVSPETTCGSEATGTCIEPRTDIDDVATLQTQAPMVVNSSLGDGDDAVESGSRKRRRRRWRRRKRGSNPFEAAKPSDAATPSYTASASSMTRSSGGSTSDKMQLRFAIFQRMAGGIAEILSKDFCWRKAYDRGVGIPANCRIDMEQRAAMCYAKCPSGFQRRSSDIEFCGAICPAGTTDIGLFCRTDGYTQGNGCTGNCPSGYTNTGCTCEPSWTSKERRYSPGVTKYDFNYISCRTPGYPDGPKQTPLAAFCYPEPAPGYSCDLTACREDCPAHLVSCGLGSCAANAGACVGEVGKMILGITQALVDTALLVISLGAYGAGAAQAKQVAIKKSVQATFKATAKASLQRVKEALRNAATKQAVINYVKDSFTKDSVSEFVKGKIEAAGDAILAEAFKAFQEKIEASSEDELEGFDWTKLDPTNLAAAIKSSAEGDEPIEQAKAWTEFVSTFDPTGWITVAANFMHPFCGDGDNVASPEQGKKAVGDAAAISQYVCGDGGLIQEVFLPDDKASALSCYELCLETTQKGSSSGCSYFTYFENLACRLFTTCPASGRYNMANILVDGAAVPLTEGNGKPYSYEMGVPDGFELVSEGTVCPDEYKYKTYEGLSKAICAHRCNIFKNCVYFAYTAEDACVMWTACPDGPGERIETAGANLYMHVSRTKGSYVLGDIGESCTSACSADGLACSTHDLEVHNDDITSEEAIGTVVTGLGLQCDETAFMGGLDYLPAWRLEGNVCLGTYSSRSSSDYNCDSTIAHGNFRRICWCSPKKVPGSCLQGYRCSEQCRYEWTAGDATPTCSCPDGSAETPSTCDSEFGLSQKPQ